MNTRCEINTSPPLASLAQARREIRDGADGGVFVAPFEADLTTGGVSGRRCRHPGAGRGRAASSSSDSVAARSRMPSASADGAPRRFVARHRIVEEHHHAVAEELRERAALRRTRAGRRRCAARRAPPSRPRVPSVPQRA